METVLYTFHFNWLDCVWWLIPLTLSAIFIAAWVSARKNRRPSLGGKIGRVAGALMTLFCVMITVVWIGLPILSYFVIKSQIAAEKYSEVIGAVEEFSPMPWSGHQQETFAINGVSFSYSTFEIKSGYHTTASWGGIVTHNGQHLKIRYLGASEYKVITYIAEVTE